MACPASGEISLFKIALEMETDNYNNSTSISAYHGYGYALMSLTNMSGGASGFDSINTNNDAADRPDGSAPH